jgi:hypothetical protein
VRLEEVELPRLIKKRGRRAAGSNEGSAGRSVTSTGARRSGFAASMPPKTRADDDNLRLSIRHALVLARCLSSHNIQDRATIERLKTSQIRFSRRFRCRERGSLGGVEHPPRGATRLFVDSRCRRKTFLEHHRELPRQSMRLSRSPTPRARFRPASPNRKSRRGSPRR